MPLAKGERIYHLALQRDWVAAQDAGDYRVSTLGSTLDEVGFVHASRSWQVQAVYDGFYREVREPLVLLEIDPAKLTSEVRLEVPARGEEAFPHIYGPLDLPAVVSALPWPQAG